MKENVFNSIEDCTGESLNERTVNNLDKLNHKQKVELVEAIEWDYRRKHWFTDDDELPEFEQFPDREAIITDSEGNNDGYELWENPSLIKNLLLYYNSVAVLDPIDEILSHSVEMPGVLAKQLKVLLPLKELIDADIIRLVPYRTARKAVIDQIDISGLIVRYLFHEKNSDLFDAIRLHSPDNFELVSSLNLDMPFLLLNAEESNTLKFGFRGKNDYNFGTYHFAAIILKEIIIQKWIADLNDSQIAATSTNYINFYSRISNLDIKEVWADEKLISNFLLPLKLPNIDKLSWEDIVALRKNDEDFKTWRDMMKEVLSESRYRGSYNDKLFLKNLGETVTAKSRVLRENIKSKKSIGEKIKNTSIQSGIGFVGGILTGSVEMALISAGATGGLQFLHDLFFKKPTKGETALFNHFSIFMNNK